MKDKFVLEKKKKKTEEKDHHEKSVIYIDIR